MPVGPPNESSEGTMRRHARSGATFLVALSLVALGCGEKAPSAPIIGSHAAQLVPGRADEAGRHGRRRRVGPAQRDHSLGAGHRRPDGVVDQLRPQRRHRHAERRALRAEVRRTTVSVTARGYSDATSVTVRPSVRDVAFDSDSLAISLVAVGEAAVSRHGQRRQSGRPEHARGRVGLERPAGRSAHRRRDRHRPRDRLRGPAAARRPQGGHDPCEGDGEARRQGRGLADQSRDRRHAECDAHRHDVRRPG